MARDKATSYSANLLKELILKYAEQNDQTFKGYDYDTKQDDEAEFLRPRFNTLWEDEDVQSLLKVLAKPMPKGDLGTEEDYLNKLEEIVFKKCSELDKK